MPFTGANYESIRQFFGYNLSDLEYIKRSCDHLEEFSTSAKNITSVDYVVKVQDLLDLIETEEANISLQFDSRRTGVISYEVSGGESVEYRDDAYGGQVDTQSKVDNARRELELLFWDYDLTFQQTYTVKS